MIHNIWVIAPRECLKMTPLPMVVKQHDLYLSKDHFVDCWNGLEVIQRRVIKLAFNIGFQRVVLDQQFYLERYQQQHSQGPPQTQFIRNSGSGSKYSEFEQAFPRILMHSKVWDSLPYWLMISLLFVGGGFCFVLFLCSCCCVAGVFFLHLFFVSNNDI